MFEVEDVRASTRYPRTLQDDVASEKRLKAAFARDDHVRAQAGGVVHHHDLRRDVLDSSSRRATFEAVAEDPDALARELSEASGPEHDLVLELRAGQRVRSRCATLSLVRPVPSPRATLV